ncbi:MAG: ribonuclease HII [Chloroflexi bacterium]|nr:ribonuclease HII [Chloroflexota bacterium]
MGWPTDDEEKRLFALGCRAIAGVDEAGRGPLAGPVVAGAVILPAKIKADWLVLVRDSKQLTPGQRSEAYQGIVSCAISYGVGAADAREIDRVGIVSATRRAMARAIEALEPQPDHLLIDAVDLPSLPLPQTPIIHGDALCRSIAAASIIAKVTRDRLLETVFETRYPGYGFAAHKGYGTPEHMEALRKLGPSEVHRVTFSPVKELFG